MSAFTTCRKAEDDTEEKEPKKPKNQVAKPDWIENATICNTKYFFVYSESSADDKAPTLFDNESKGNFSNQGTKSIVFAKDGTTAVISGTRLAPPVGILSKGEVQLVPHYGPEDEEHWLQSFQWRPTEASLKAEPWIKDFFTKHSYSQKTGKHDKTNWGVTNSIEFTIDATISQQDSFCWKHLDDELLQKIGPKCLRAHLHTTSRRKKMLHGGERSQESYILCPEQDYERVHSLLVKALQPQDQVVEPERQEQDSREAEEEKEELKELAQEEEAQLYETQADLK